MANMPDISGWKICFLPQFMSYIILCSIATAVVSSTAEFTAITTTTTPDPTTEIKTTITRISVGETAKNVFSTNATQKESLSTRPTSTLAPSVLTSTVEKTVTEISRTLTASTSKTREIHSTSSLPVTDLISKGTSSLRSTSMLAPTTLTSTVEKTETEITSTMVTSTSKTQEIISASSLPIESTMGHVVLSSRATQFDLSTSKTLASRTSTALTTTAVATSLLSSTEQESVPRSSSFAASGVGSTQTRIPPLTTVSTYASQPDIRTVNVENVTTLLIESTTLPVRSCEQSTDGTICEAGDCARAQCFARACIILQYTSGTCQTTRGIIGTCSTTNGECIASTIFDTTKASDVPGTLSMVSSTNIRGTVQGLITSTAKSTTGISIFFSDAPATYANGDVLVTGQITFDQLDYSLVVSSPSLRTIIETNVEVLATQVLGDSVTARVTEIKSLVSDSGARLRKATPGCVTKFDVVIAQGELLQGEVLVAGLRIIRGISTVYNEVTYAGIFCTECFEYSIYSATTTGANSAAVNSGSGGAEKSSFGTGATVGVTFMVLLIVAGGVAAIFILRRRRARSASLKVQASSGAMGSVTGSHHTPVKHRQNNPTSSAGMVASDGGIFMNPAFDDILLHNASETRKSMFANEEPATGQSFTVSRHTANASKNRYAQRLPYNETRVRLELHSARGAGADYINASHIVVPGSSTAYIAAQCPLPHTVEDFWHMAYHQQCSVIVVLCHLEETGQPQIARFWAPDGQQQQFGMYTVSSKTATETSQFTRRVVEVSCDGKGREVVVFHHHGWAEGAVAATGNSLLAMRRAVNEAEENTTGGCTVVCCADGSGRSGVYLCLDAAIKRFRRGGGADLYATVAHLRKCRPLMVTSASQYIYLHNLFVTVLVHDPPHVASGTDARVKTYIRELVVPLTVPAFDVGKAGRRVLQVDQFLLRRGKRQGPTAARVLLCNDVVVVARDAGMNVFEVEHVVDRDGLVCRACVASNLHEFTINGRALSKQLVLQCDSDAKKQRWVEHLCDTSTHVTTGKLTGSRMASLRPRSRTEAMVILGVKDPNTASGLYACIEDYKGIPKTFRPDPPAAAPVQAVNHTPRPHGTPHDAVRFPRARPLAHFVNPLYRTPARDTEQLSVINSPMSPVYDRTHLSADVVQYSPTASLSASIYADLKEAELNASRQQAETLRQQVAQMQAERHALEEQLEDERVHAELSSKLYKRTSTPQTSPVHVAMRAFVSAAAHRRMSQQSVHDAPPPNAVSSRRASLESVPDVSPAALSVPPTTLSVPPRMSQHARRISESVRDDAPAADVRTVGARAPPTQDSHTANVESSFSLTGGARRRLQNKFKTLDLDAYTEHNPYVDVSSLGVPPPLVSSTPTSPQRPAPVDTTRGSDASGSAPPAAAPPAATQCTYLGSCTCPDCV